MGTMFARFQIAGMSAFDTDKLNKSVKYAMPIGPKNFICSDVRSSGPRAVELEDWAIACLVRIVVKGLKDRFRR
jgi:hypothetical protein